MKNFLPRFPRSLAQHLPVRISLFVLLSISVLIAYWHTIKRYPLINEYQKKINDIYAFQDEVQNLKTHYPENLLYSLEPGYLNVLNLIFTNQEHLQLWSEYYQKRAFNYGLEINQKSLFSKNYKTAKSELTQLSIQYELKPLNIATSIPPHERLLLFLYEISTNQFKRIDMIELKALGDGTNFDRAVIGLQVWLLTNAP